MLVYYFVRLRTNHYTLLTISSISFIFDSARNLTRNFPYLLFDILWNYNWRDSLLNGIHTLIVSLISPTFFPRSRQFDKCISGFIISRVSACSCTISWTISWDCEPITIYFSQYRRFRSSLILQETCLIVLFDISWKYRSSGGNGKTRNEKNGWRDGLRNAIYTLLISLVLPTFFCVLANLTTSV